MGQRRLRAARVLVIGAGALGAPTLQYLAAAGVGTLGIVDDDVVDVTNLQRQVIHSAADVGRPKVDSATERVTGISPDITVIPHRERLTAANAAEVFAGYDLVLDGADNFPTRYLVSDTAAAAGIPAVWGSILRFDAQVSVFWAAPRAAAGAEAPEGVTLRDLFPVPPPPGSTPSCGQAGVVGALPGQVGSLMAGEAVKLIIGSGEPLLGRVVVIDALAPSFTVVPLRARATTDADARAVREDAALRGYLLPDEVAAGLTLEAACAHSPHMTDTPPAPASGPVPEMTVTELRAALDARDVDQGAQGPPLVVFDVREAAERTIGIIPDDAHAPLADVLDDPAGVADTLGLRGAHVAVYCRSGARSHSAAMALRAVGVDAVNVTGGILAWGREIDPSIPEY